MCEQEQLSKDVETKHSATSCTTAAWHVSHSCNAGYLQLHCSQLTTAPHAVHSCTAHLA